jgi:hypothetical protein
MGISELIAGYTVDIEPHEDREGVDCWVSKGRFSASLACLEGEGGLFNDQGQMQPVPEAILDRIRSFAEQHGY